MTPAGPDSVDGSAPAHWKGPSRGGGDPVPGHFVTIEGGEGTGKSTLLAALSARAHEAGLEVVVTREPGGTALGERLRDVLLGGPAAPDPRAELLLFCAARAQLVGELIRPALEAGALVLCDRFSDSTIAYQHGGRGLPLDIVRAANAVATGGLAPDLTLVLDLDPAEGLRRVGRARDYLERESPGFHARVRQAFLDLAREEPDRVRVLDATAAPAALAEQAWAALQATGLLPATPRTQ